mmetsp:Transcript_66975/g.148408  ORF Transcript_66975/g.148408 Transcript_66975/m.148408 type:complete len:232 (+) Transcript_66975:46-741(+)
MRRTRWMSVYTLESAARAAGSFHQRPAQRRTRSAPLQSCFSRNPTTIAYTKKCSSGPCSSAQYARCNDGRRDDALTAPSRRLHAVAAMGRNSKSSGLRKPPPVKRKAPKSKRHQWPLASGACAVKSSCATMMPVRMTSQSAKRCEAAQRSARPRWHAKSRTASSSSPPASAFPAAGATRCGAFAEAPLAASKAAVQSSRRGARSAPSAVPHSWRETATAAECRALAATREG